ncbi:MAG TPA: hypothetical protein DDY78_03800 [Planctomycetales bacterium]|jgi:hypothetical protein|nr:hypothetical protein [Planctomycetales bacterium]
MATVNPRTVLATAVCCVAFVIGCNPDRAVTEGPKPGKDRDQPAQPGPAQPVRPDARKPAPAAPNPDPKPPAPQPSPKADKPTEPAKDHPANSDPKPPAPKPADVVGIEGLIGISPDLKVYADFKTLAADTGGLGFKVVDLETGKSLPSPKWDRDWGWPSSAAFAEDVIAVVTGKVSFDAVKIFSRKTGELEQNVHGEQISGAAFTPDGRFLAITEFRPPYQYLVLRDIQGKKTIADLPLGGAGYCSLAVTGNRVAAYESQSGQLTVVEAATGKLVKTIKTEEFRKSSGSDHAEPPLAISPEGNLLAFEAEDSVLLYDIAKGKVAHKLEGHLDTVQAVAFSPNGETVASAAKDKTIRFWNVKEGKEVKAIKDLPAGASKLIFSADGKKIAVVYHNRLKPTNAEIRSVGAD